jgi:hypothetical protein
LFDVGKRGSYVVKSEVDVVIFELHVIKMAAHVVIGK